MGALSLLQTVLLTFWFCLCSMGVVEAYQHPHDLAAAVYIVIGVLFGWAYHWIHLQLIDG